MAYFSTLFFRRYSCKRENSC